MANSSFYCIAGFYIKIDFKHSALEQFQVPRQYAPFQIAKEECGPILFSLVVDNEFTFKEKGKIIGHFRSGENHHDVYLLPENGYQIEVYDSRKDSLACLLQTNSDFTNLVIDLKGDFAQHLLGFNHAMMIGFAFASAPHRCLLIHASVITYQQKGYLFLGKSGTGKSTHSSLWIKNFEGAELLNDDNPALRIVNNCAFVYGTPWSGKTPCYKNQHVPIGAIVMLSQKPYNKISHRRVIDNFSYLISSCSSIIWDHRIQDVICDNLTHILPIVSIYFLECLPNDEAAQICKETIVK